MGHRRGALPLEMGTRLPPRLPLRRPIHRRASRGGRGAGSLPDRNRQARGGRGHSGAFRAGPALADRGHRWRSGAPEPQLPCHANFGFAADRTHPSGGRGRTRASGLGRRHRLLHDQEEHRGDCTSARRPGTLRAALSLRPFAGTKARSPARLSRWRHRRRSRYQRLRHGHRQA